MELKGSGDEVQLIAQHPEEEHFWKVTVALREHVVTFGPSAVHFWVKTVNRAAAAAAACRRLRYGFTC